MKKKSARSKNNNTRLGLYFTSLVLFIILTSFVLKVFDEFISSKFDGKNKFTVEIKGEKKTDIISLSPKEGSVAKISLENFSKSALSDLEIPSDVVIDSDLTSSSSPKTYFVHLLMHYKKIHEELNLVDLMRLILFTQGADKDKVYDQAIDNKDDLSLLSNSFIDPKILDERLSIQVINAADVPGLGNRIAKLIGNLGGNVILVKTSTNSEKYSRIYYLEDSYTARKLSKILNIPLEKKRIDALSDIYIVIGSEDLNKIKF